MQAIETEDGTRIAYRVFGSGPRGVLLVHGWMTAGAIYDELIEALDLRGLRLVVPDLRGCGQSGRAGGGYDLSRQARDLFAVLDAEALSAPVLVGHSMGGQLAQFMAADRPDRIGGLFLLCPVPAMGLALPDEARGLFRGCAGDRTMLGTILDMACKELSAASRERLLDLAAPIAPACIKGAFDAWSGGGFAERLGQIRAPALVVATDDPFLPPAFLREAVCAPIKRSRLAVLPGPGHYPQVERPGQTAALLEAFLAGLG